ncbi:pyridoxamine 5'-phosphate oxidase family protein [Streptomyces bambusae]|uniref:pyridoxamine 5'-phosphate oxidase family protein n=1 Tax=Streptomyces bambusae TaxID=1550616 RepID=UPI001CFE44D3|nr:pyridoxamine 5'-phosphate oxidase family protein [Streptomyces bambusae]MCB5163844.1 pyridoxamine 5'-phosphate oxidase family protein [Streptomyces bambusae]
MNGRAHGGPPAPSTPAGPGRTVEELTSGEALALLGSVGLGRVVFTRHALPAVRPVNHLLDAGDIIIRPHDGSTLTALLESPEGAGVVVAYEADTIDPATRLGWSVVVTGYATSVTDPAELERFTRLLRPWVDGTFTGAIRITPALVTGFRLN